MKNRLYLFAASLFVAALMQGCGKEDVAEDKNYGDISYKIELAGMSEEGSDSKAIFSSNDFLKLIFEDGDIIRVNGYSFTLHSNQGVWRAYGNSSDMTNDTHDTLLGTSFSCFYGKSPATTSSSQTNYSDGVYGRVSFTSGPSNDPDDASYQQYTSGIVLAGQTNDTVITLYPSFAVIKIYKDTRYDLYTVNHIALGFDDNKVVNYANLTPNNGNYPSLSSCTYLTGVEKEIVEDPFDPEESGEVKRGHFLLANKNDLVSNAIDENNSYHVIVPLADTVNTTIYLKTKMTRKSNGNTVIKYLKMNNVTLECGKVYTISLP